MRFLLLLVSVGYASANYIYSSENSSQSSLISYDVHENRSRVRRFVVDFQAPDVKQFLTTASSVFTALGDVHISKNFKETFAKIPANKFKNAMKGLSILGSIAAALITVGVEDDTQLILNTLNQNFKKLEDKMTSQTANINSHISHTMFRYNVMVPVLTAERARRKYQATIGTNITNEEAKEEFLTAYDNDNSMDRVFVIIGTEYEALQNLIMNSTNYNRSQIIEMQSTIYRYFTGAFSILNFRAGIRFNYFTNRTKYNHEIAYIDKQYNEDLAELNAINARILKNFDDNYWASVPSVVREAVDKGGDNCQLAQKVVNSIKAKGFTHFVHVIVSDKVKWFDQYIVYGLPTMLIQDYAGKTIIVTKPTTENDNARSKNIKAYTDNKMEEQICWNLTYTSSLQSAKVFDFAAKGKFQMAMYKNEEHYPCAVSEKPQTLRFIVTRYYLMEHYIEWAAPVMF